MQNFSTYLKAKKKGQKSLCGTTLTGLGLGTTGTLFTKGTNLIGLGRAGNLGLFTRGGNLGEGARGANLALGARGTFGAREKEANDLTELTLETFGTTGTLGATLKPESEVTKKPKKAILSRNRCKFLNRIFGRNLIKQPGCGLIICKNFRATAVFMHFDACNIDLGCFRRSVKNIVV